MIIYSSTGLSVHLSSAGVNTGAGGLNALRITELGMYPENIFQKFK